MDPTTPTTTDSGRRSRRTTALGVGAGLVGGGLVGLLMTVPSFTSAASEETGDTVVAALQDADTTDGATDTTTDERPEPGERLRELLQPLVDDGTIDAAQADAVTEYLVEHRPEGRHGDRDHGRRGGRAAFDGEVVAELIGIDVEDLRVALLDGQSVADVAAANGVDAQTVIDALVAEAEAHLDLAVESGRLTEAEAAEKLDQLTERITDRVNGERPARG